MAAGNFDSASFDGSVGGFDTGAASSVTAIVGGGYNPSQGYSGYETPQRTKQDVARDRERFGIPDEVRLAIEAVAAQQAARLEQDAQKRFEELSRELELRGIEWDARYLESLNYERERLINAEIALLIRQRLQNEEELMLLVLMAAAV